MAETNSSSVVARQVFQNRRVSGLDREIFLVCCIAETQNMHESVMASGGSDVWRFRVQQSFDWADRTKYTDFF